MAVPITSPEITPSLVARFQKQAKMYMERKAAAVIENHMAVPTAIILAGLPTYLDSFRQLQNSNPYLMVISFLLILTNGWLIFTNKDIIKRKS